MAFTFQDRRKTPDRRKKPTAGLSRHTVSGRRMHFRRKEDQTRGGVVLIVVLNIFDAILTTIILDGGGWEMNPVVRAAIETYGDRFWIWKFAIVSIAVVKGRQVSRCGRHRPVRGCCDL